MRIPAAAMQSRVASIDQRLVQLAAELRRLRGEYAAEASLLEQIDRLLDRRLVLTAEFDAGWVRREHPSAA